MIKTILANCIEKLNENISNPCPEKAWIGFDGFVDKIQKIIKIQTPENTEYFKQISDFGQLILDSAGKSAGIGISTIEVKLGGNGPLMANSLAAAGIQNYCVGAMGYPDLHPAFKHLNPNCKINSYAFPAETDALEFQDGKIMLNHSGVFRIVDWKLMKERLGMNFFIRSCTESKLIALVDWANLAHCTKIWEEFANEVHANIPNSDRLFFFDLADPTKKGVDQLIEVFKIIGKYRKFGKVVLGLNENEALKVHAAFEYKAFENQNKEYNLAQIGKKVFENIDVDWLFIHPTNRSLGISKDSCFELPGKYISNPIISTGGGDNFNAGLCFGLLNNFSIEESMVYAMATSGAYVSMGYSPTVAEVLKYIKNWLTEI